MGPIKLCVMGKILLAIIDSITLKGSHLFAYYPFQ